MAKRTGRYHSWGKTKASFSYAILDAGKQLTEFAKMDLALLAEELLSEWDAEWPRSTSLQNGAKFGGDHNHPWYYGQLHDSVAIRIADKNRTVAVRYMPPAATHPQKASVADAGQAYNNIIGADFARLEAERARWFFLPGLQVQLLIGVPYARKVDEMGRHMGYIDTLGDDIVNKVDDFMWSGSLWKRRLIRSRTK